MKILISKKQAKILSENEIYYTDEKLQEFFAKGVDYLNKMNKVKTQYANKIITLSLNDLIEEEGKYITLKNNLKQFAEQIDVVFDKLYAVVEIYDITDRPQIVSNLEYNVVNKIEDVKNKVEDLYDVLESLLDATNNMKNIIDS